MRLNAAETYVVVKGLQLLLDETDDDELKELIWQTLKRFKRSHAALARLEWRV